MGRAGWLGEELDASLASAGDSVRVTGFDDDDLVDLYSGGACFPFSSVAEDFGFPPLEAMARGASS